MGKPRLETQESYYEVLNLSRKSSISEIIAAYHSAKSAFSRQSLATYSLMSQQETQAILGRLEEAYLVLSNPEKKREYDRLINQEGTVMDQTTPTKNQPLRPVVAAVPTEPALDTAATQTEEIEVSQPDRVIDGNFLRQVRERRQLSIEDVARITKIPSKFIRSIEEGNKKTIPARVYAQGFLKNIAALYKLDPQATAVAYLKYMDTQN